MSTTRMLAGAVLLGVGVVLALLFPELRFLWFQGRPLGIVLIVVGALDLAEGYFRGRWAGRRATGEAAGAGDG